MTEKPAEVDSEIGPDERDVDDGDDLGIENTGDDRGGDPQAGGAARDRDRDRPPAPPARSVRSSRSSVTMDTATEAPD